MLRYRLGLQNKIFQYGHFSKVEPLHSKYSLWTGLIQNILIPSNHQFTNGRHYKGPKHINLQDCRCKIPFWPMQNNVSVEVSPATPKCEMETLVTYVKQENNSFLQREIDLSMIKVSPPG